MKKLELKKCPFCGHEFQIVPSNSYGFYEKGSDKLGVQHVLPEGADCPISTSTRSTVGKYTYSTKTELVADWNKRYCDE